MYLAADYILHGHSEVQLWAGTLSGGLVVEERSNGYDDKRLLR